MRTHAPATLVQCSCDGTERIFIELMTSDRKLKASREGSKCRIYGISKI